MHGTHTPFHSHVATAPHGHVAAVLHRFVVATALQGHVAAVLHRLVVATALHGHVDVVQEARIEVENDVVKNVQVLVRRSRGPKPEPPA